MTSTGIYPHFKFPFATFNPVQESVLGLYATDCNLVISANMASGKTTIAEMVIGHELSKPSGKVAYISPLCAISAQMEHDWREIPMLDYYLAPLSCPKSMLTDKRLFIHTVEGMDVIVRRRDPVVKELTCAIFDEAHLIADASRGPDAESLIMSLTRVNPGCRILFLSGTLGNSRELASWLKGLNGKPTSFIKSDWRPCPLDKEMEVIASEDAMIEAMVSKVSDSMYDKVLIFVHSKVQGRKIAKRFLSEGIRCGFFSADLNAARARSMLAMFKDPASGFDVLVATSALGMGVNL